MFLVFFYFQSQQKAAMVELKLLHHDYIAKIPTTWRQQHILDNTDVTDVIVIPCITHYTP